MNYYTEDKEDEGILCPDCGGTGSHPYLDCGCRRCGGSGMIEDSYKIEYPLVSYRELMRKKKNTSGDASKPEI